MDPGLIPEIVKHVVTEGGVVERRCLNIGTPIRLQYAHDLVQDGGRIGDVFQCRDGVDDIEASVRETQRSGLHAAIFDRRVVVPTPYCLHHVDPNNFARTEQRENLTDHAVAATNLEYSLATGLRYDPEHRTKIGLVIEQPMQIFAVKPALLTGGDKLQHNR